jgi:hypothetical protein
VSIARGSLEPGGGRGDNLDEYLQRGNEPEGALRAVLECVADPAAGAVVETTR